MKAFKRTLWEAVRRTAVAFAIVSYVLFLMIPAPTVKARFVDDDEGYSAPVTPPPSSSSSSVRLSRAEREEGYSSGSEESYSSSSTSLGTSGGSSWSSDSSTSSSSTSSSSSSSSGSGFFGGLWNKAKSVVSSAVSSVTSAASSTWETVKSTASSAWSSASSMASETVESVRTAARDTWETVEETVSDTWNTVTSTASTVVETTRSVASAAVQTVKTATSAVVQTVESAVSSTVATVESAASNAWDSVKSGAASAWETTKSVAKTAAMVVVNNADKIAAVAGTVATVATVVGTVAMFIPGAQPVAAALLGVGRIAGGVAAVAGAIGAAKTVYDASQGTITWQQAAGRVALEGLAIASPWLAKGAGSLVKRVAPGVVQRMSQATSSVVARFAPTGSAAHTLATAAARQESTAVLKGAMKGQELKNFRTNVKPAGEWPDRAEMRKAVKLLRENGASTTQVRQTITAHGKDMWVETRREDLNVVRYYNADLSVKPIGRWLTETPVMDPLNRLALPLGTKAEKVASWVIPKNSTVIRSTVAAQPTWGNRPGGGTQIFLPNPGVLRPASTLTQAVNSIRNSVFQTSSTSVVQSVIRTTVRSAVNGFVRWR